jgi:hypothetical protein
MSKLEHRAYKSHVMLGCLGFPGLVGNDLPVLAKPRAALEHETIVSHFLWVLPRFEALQGAEAAEASTEGVRGDKR